MRAFRYEINKRASWPAKLERPCVRAVKTTSRSPRVLIEHAGLLANGHVDPRSVLDRTLEH
jgi:hypothetical protein